MMKLVGDDLHWDLRGIGGFLDVIMVIFAWILWSYKVTVSSIIGPLPPWDSNLRPKQQKL
jgi:hypothetical protein